MKKSSNRIIAFILTLTMLISMAITASALKLEEFTDYPGNGFWANEALQAALDNGLIYGRGDGVIDSGANLTRAEMAAIIVRAFGATEMAELSGFNDVDADEWYYNEFSKAVRMGIFIGDGSGNLNPDSPITREEAFTVFSRAIVLSEADYSPLSKFNDEADISDWSKEFLAPLVKRGYVNGDHLGNINPKANITRAEFAQVMHNMFKKYYSASGDYLNVGPDSAVINTENVNLTGITVEDDLVIGDGANLSTINLTDVKIGGRLVVRGAAVVKLTNVTTGGGVVVKNVNATVHFDNFRTEDVFDGINMVTRATFKEGFSVSTGDSPSGGSSSTPSYDYHVKYYKQNIAKTGYILDETVTLREKSGTRVSVTPEEIEGYTLNTEKSTLSGRVASTGLVLEVYYDTNAYSITFVNNGETVKTEPVTQGYALTDAKMPTAEEASYVEYGYKENAEITGVDGAEEYHHIVNFGWWYNAGTDEEADWQLFLPHITDDEGSVIQEGTVVTADTEVYLASPLLSLRGYVEKFDDRYPEGFPFDFYYEPDSRFADTLLSILRKVKPGMSGNDIIVQPPLTPISVISEDGYQKLRDFGITDADNNILLQEFMARFVTIIGEDSLEETIRDNAEEMFKTSEKLNTALPEYLTMSAYNDAELGRLVRIITNVLNTSLDADSIKTSLLTNSYIAADVTASSSNEEFAQSVVENIGRLDTALVDLIAENLLIYIKIDAHEADLDYIVNQIIDKQYSDTLVTFMDELKQDDQFRITPDTSFLADGLMLEVDEYDFNKIKEGIPEQLFKIYPEEALARIYNSARDNIINQIETGLDAVENSGETEAFIDCGFTLVINPVDDIYRPTHSQLITLLESRVGTNYYYAENDFLQALIDLYDYTNYFEVSDAESGYKLKTVEEYYDILVKAAILSDDALVWYHENLDMDELNEVIDDYETLVLKYVNVVADALDRYATDGTLPDAANNDIVKALEEALRAKFPELIDSAVDWYKTSPINKDYTGDDYAKVKEAINFIITNVNITTDEMFDNVLADKYADNKITDDKYQFSFQNNWITIERSLFK